MVGIITAIIIATIAFLNSEHGNPTRAVRARRAVAGSRARAASAGIVQYLPASPDDIRAVVMDWLRDHTAQLQGAGKQAVRIIVQVIIGIVIGADGGVV